VNVLLEVFPCNLRDESCSVIWFLRSRRVAFLFLEAISIKRITGEKIRQVLFKTESRKIKQKNGLGG